MKKSLEGLRKFSSEESKSIKITPLPTVISYEEKLICAAQEERMAVNTFRKRICREAWEIRGDANVELGNACHAIQAAVLEIAKELFPDVSGSKIQFPSGHSVRWRREENDN